MRGLLSRRGDNENVGLALTGVIKGIVGTAGGGVGSGIAR